MLSSIKDFYAMEEGVTQTFYNTYGGFCNYFIKNFDMYLALLGHFDKKDYHLFIWEKQYCLVLLVKLCTTLKSSYQLIIEGYYSESIILTRSLYEALVRIVFVKNNVGKAEKVAGKEFKIGENEKLLGFKDSSFYPLLSSFSHGHELPVFLDIIDIGKGIKKGISIGPQPPVEDLPEFLVSINMLMFYFWALLLIVNKAFPEIGNDKYRHDIYEKGILDLEVNYIRKYINKYGQVSILATGGADEIKGIVEKLPNWPTT